MTQKLNQLFSLFKTPQSSPIPGRNQKKNAAGGYLWQVDQWTYLDRFLILGSESGTYYTQARELTQENATNLLKCLADDGVRTVNRIVDISQSGRAPKNDQALFALAIATAVGDEQTRKAAFDALPKVARTGTHLFQFLNSVQEMRGWGRGLRNAIGRWYTERLAEKLAFQTIKYRQRDNWTHRDALRLAHPIAPTEQHNIIFHWITQGWPGVGEQPHPEKALQQIWAYERAKELNSATEIIQLIKNYNLPWEAIPTDWLAKASIWEALLPTMPMNALIRNLGRMGSNGLLAPNSDAVNQVVAQLADTKRIHKARLHPISILAALLTYKNGRGIRGSKSWNPVPQIIDALDNAFYTSFKNVPPTNKRFVLGIDVSGSMEWGSIGNTPGLTPRLAAATMAMVTMRTESNYFPLAFSHHLTPLNISPRQRLDDVVKTMATLAFGATDAALPMIWALEHKIKADAFIIYTDNETWYGNIHPVQALQQYRKKMGIDAKLIVVGMTATEFSIADPKDAGMLDIVGFDTAVPQLISDFITG